MNPALKSRIARITSPNVVELDLKRNARFGRLNIAPTFDLIAHVSASEARGDIRKQFARIVARPARVDRMHDTDAAMRGML